jgi:hypothetical protein
MKFRTEIEPVDSGFKINLRDSIITVGSCFSEVIGSRLSENKLNCLCNPFGTVFNPSSIFKLLRHSLSKQPVHRHLFAENTDGYWNHFDFHSKFTSDSRENLESELLVIYDNVFQALRSCKVLVITLGTANIYELKSNNQVVANCHKQPQKMFNHRLLTLKEIQRDFQQFYDLLRMVNSKIKIIFTVSPVRHTRDGLKANSISKSLLRMACHSIEQENPNVSYFPSYEIMLDDLRDYRFYKSDLVHPNEMAEQYIFEHFTEIHFSDKLKEFMHDWQQIKNSLHHRPFRKESPAHQTFLAKLLEKLNNYNEKVNVSTEIEEVRSQLIAA